MRMEIVEGDWKVPSINIGSDVITHIYCMDYFQYSTTPQIQDISIGFCPIEDIDDLIIMLMAYFDDWVCAESVIYAGEAIDTNYLDGKKSPFKENDRGSNPELYSRTHWLTEERHAMFRAGIHLRELKY